MEEQEDTDSALTKAEDTSTQGEGLAENTAKDVEVGKGLMNADARIRFDEVILIYSKQLAKNAPVPELVAQKDASRLFIVPTVTRVRGRLATAPPAQQARH